MEKGMISEEAQKIVHEIYADINRGLEPKPRDRYSRLPLDFKEKFIFLRVEDLIKRNANCPDWFERLSVALDFLYKLGSDLLKPRDKRRQRWWSIDLSNEEFSPLFGIHALGHILKKLGYQKLAKGSFMVRYGQEITESRIVGVMAELLLAKEEVSALIRGEHILQDDICNLVPSEFQPPKQMSKQKITTGCQKKSLHMISSGLTKDETAASTKSSSQPSSLTGTEKRCPHCDCINLSEADLCISCAEPPTGKTSEDRQKANMLGDDISCSHCTFLNKSDSTLCLMCSKSLRISRSKPDDADSNVNVPAKGPEDDVEEKGCPRCTYINPRDAAYCEMCALLFKEGINEPEASGNSASHNPLPLASSGGRAEGILPEYGRAKGTPGLTDKAEIFWKQECQDSLREIYEDENKVLCDPPCRGPLHDDTVHEDRLKCSSCDIQYCTDCKNPYLKKCHGRKCPWLRHCHHSRMCRFFLRILPEDNLQRLLQENFCPFESYSAWSQKAKHYSSYSAYKDYLIEKIKRFRLDPAEIMDKYRLVRIIEQNLDSDIEILNETRDTLCEFVQTNIPVRRTGKTYNIKEGDDTPN